MCRKLESSHGFYHNKLTVGRFILCCSGVILVVILGVAVGLLAYYMSAISDTLYKMHNAGNMDYQFIADIKDDNIFILSSSCKNFEAMKERYEDSLVYRCNNTYCVPLDLRCSGYYDCTDESDEYSCEEFCSLGVKSGVRFKCDKRQTTPRDPKYGPAQPKCFLSYYKCDGGVDCADDSPNEDEDCLANKSFSFMRDNTTVVCSNGNNFLCEDKKFCIRDSDACDGFTTCFDGSDEMDCRR